MAAQKRVFVLGGGAALGAHRVGALRYLAEQDTKPDAIVASSIGVISACGYASGGIPAFERAWNRFRSLPRIVSPSLRHDPPLGLSLLSMDALSAAVEEHIDFPEVFASRLESEFILLNLSRGHGQMLMDVRWRTIGNSGWRTHGQRPLPRRAGHHHHRAHRAMERLRPLAVFQAHARKNRMLMAHGSRDAKRVLAGRGSRVAPLTDVSWPGAS